VDERVAAVERAADALRQALRVASALVESNRPVDLTGLDGEIGRLCAHALDLMPADGRLIRPRLIALRAELDELMAAFGPEP
jgi:hypothetical protein